MAKPFSNLSRKLSRKDFLAELAAVADACRQQIAAEVDGFAPGDAARELRLEQASTSLTFFKRTYFPHYANVADSDLHAYLHARQVKGTGTGMREAVAAPRGNAKSTDVAVIYVCWRITQQRLHYGILVMDTYEQAAAGIEAIKAELEANPRLAQDYPDAVGAGRVWREGVVLTAQDIKIEGAGANKRIRGRRHGPHRPDLLILDDIENDENVQTPEQRDKLYERVMKSFLNLGPPDDSMDVVFVGTILHYDSVLGRVLDKHPTWVRKRFAAIVRWPDRMDLWDAWEELLRNGQVEQAERFYARRRKLMEAGSQVLWPAMQPIYHLMKKRVDIGFEAFDSEYQNDPVALKDAPLAGITVWVQHANDWLYFGACDPSLGKHGKGRDPAAILTGGYSRSRGVLDVIEATIARMKPSLILEEIIRQHLAYNTQVFAVEAIQFQEYFREQVVEVSAQRHIHVPARPIMNSTDKTLRIQSLQPHIDNQLIRIHPGHRVLQDQLRRWPKADHDDGPDALEMLWATARRYARGLTTITTDAQRAHDETAAMMEHYA